MSLSGLQATEESATYVAHLAEVLSPNPIESFRGLIRARYSAAEPSMHLFQSQPQQPTLDPSWSLLLEYVRWNTVISSFVDAACYQFQHRLDWRWYSDPAQSYVLDEPDYFLIGCTWNSQPKSQSVFACGISNYLHAAPSSIRTDEEGLLLDLAERLSTIAAVQAVYHQKCRDEHQITVAIDSSTYDPDLMDKLLDEEYEARQRAGDRILSFTYPPTGQVDRRQVVHPKARLVYLRQALQWQISLFT